jgi:hypothetical protein
MTSPISGPSIVWALGGSAAPHMMTAVAVPFNAAAAAAGTTATGVGGTRAGTSGTATASAKSSKGWMLSAMGREQVYAFGMLLYYMALF